MCRLLPRRPCDTNKLGDGDDTERFIKLEGNAGCFLLRDVLRRGRAARRRGTRRNGGHRRGGGRDDGSGDGGRGAEPGRDGGDRSRQPQQAAATIVVAPDAEAAEDVGASFAEGTCAVTFCLNEVVSSNGVAHKDLAS